MRSFFTFIMSLAGGLAIVATTALTAHAAPADYPIVSNEPSSTSQVRVFLDAGCTGQYILLNAGEDNRTKDPAQTFPNVDIPWPKSYRAAGATSVDVFSTPVGGGAEAYEFTLDRGEGVHCFSTALNRVYRVYT